MGKNKFKKRIKSIYCQQDVVMYDDIYWELVNKAVRAFRWEGLPETIDVRKLELTLIKYGCASFVEIEGHIYGLQASETAPFNIYNEGSKLRVFGFGYSREHKRYFNSLTTGATAVLIRDNDVAKPFEWYITRTAYRLWDIEKSIDNNCNATKVPFILRGSESDQLTLVSIYDDIKYNVPFIQVDNSLSNDATQPFETKVPYIADKLRELSKDYRNAFNSRLGLNSIETQKKEHLLVDEINANNESIDNDVATRLRCRQEALELAKQLWPEEFKNAKVSLNIPEPVEAPESKEEEQNV